MFKENLIKIKGKISPEKNPESVKRQCDIREKNCITDAVCCELRDTWHYFTCLFIDIIEPDLENDDWICPQYKKMDM